MNILTDMWRYACAASIPDCRALIPRSIITIPMRNCIDEAHAWEDDNRIVLAFAGTRATVADWWMNLQIKPNVDGIHSGYAEAMSYFLPSIADYLRGAVGKPIYITGHSQGGAQACVAAYYLRRLHYIKIARVVSFGAPPFALREDYSVPIVTRVICGRDPVECGFLPARRADDRVHLRGSSGGHVLPILDHDWCSYTDGLIEYCLGDQESRTMLYELYDVLPQTFTKLER